MPRNICLAFTCFWSLFLLTDSVSADWLFILSRLLAIQQPGNTHGIYLNPPSHDHLSFAICYLSFRRSRFPCPRYSSCIRRLSRRSAMGPEATISPCCSKYPLSATSNARPAFCSTRRTAPENFSRTSAIIDRTSLINRGDKPSDGSSSRRIRGRAINPLAIASICCCPPLSSPPLAVRFVARTLQ